jgi:hypothetical protein
MQPTIHCNKVGHRSGKCPGFSPDELRVAFSIPSGSLFLVNQPVYKVSELRLSNLISRLFANGFL